MSQQKPLIIDAGTIKDLPAGDQLEVNAGTAALPGVTFVGDPNTGIYSSAADEVSISTGGAQRVVVNASGNVGINNAAPTFLVDTLSTTDDSGVKAASATGNHSVGLHAQNTSGGLRGIAIKAYGPSTAGTFLGSADANNTLLVAYGANTSAVKFGTDLDAVPFIFGNKSSANGELSGRERFRLASDGTVVVNEQGLPYVNFRVESGGNTNMLFVDAVNNKVGIGAVPGAPLTVDGGSTSGEIVQVKSSVDGNVALSVSNATSGASAQASLYLVTDGPNGRYGSFAVTSNAWTTDGLSLANQYQSVTATGLTNGILVGTQAANAPIVFSASSTNGAAFLVSSERLRIGSTEVSVNGNGEDVDFRVEGNNEPNLLFVNAGDDRIGIGTAVPNTALEVVSTTGDGGVRVTGSGANTTPTYYIRTPDSGYGRMIWENAAGTDQWVYYAGTDGSGAQTSWSLNDAVAGKDRLTIWGGANLALGMIVNTGNANYDFTIKGASDSSLFVVDASEDKVGIGTASPATLLDVAGVVTANGVTIDSTDGLAVGSTSPSKYAATSPAQITADQNDYNLGTGTFFRLSSNASRNITGLANGADGRMVYLVNVGANNIVLQNQNAGSTDANKIITGTGADVTLAPDNAATLIYDATTQRWRILSVQQ